MVKKTRSSKAKDVLDGNDELFTGGNEGISWYEFDSIIGDWLLKNYGSRFGKQLWHGTLVNLLKLDLRNFDDEHECEQHKSMVRDVLTETSPKQAETTIKSKQLDTTKWHVQWRVRQCEKLCLQLKETAGGEAHRLVNEAGHKNMMGIRNKLTLRFANIQSPQLKHRQKQHTLGMPSSPGAPMFAEDCNVERQLDKMEKEKKCFYDVCPKEERDTNEHVKESTLVRLISDNLPHQCQPAWNRLETQIAMRKMAAGDKDAGKLDSATDTINKSFSSAWLPPHQDVRICLRIRELNFQQSSKFDCKMRNLLAKEFKLLNTRAQKKCAGGAATGAGRPRRAQAATFGVL